MALPATANSAAPRGNTAASISIPRALGVQSSVIVLLRNKQKGLAARSSARALSVHQEVTPLVSMLRSAGAKVVASGRTLPFVLTDVTAAQRRALAAEPNVQLVVPNVVIPAPSPELATTATTIPSAVAKSARRHNIPSFAPSICGTATNPESDPEAINVINAPQAAALGYDGAGVTVAYIADGVNPANPDFQRNSAYASAGSPTGSPVLTQVNFTGDPAGTPTSGGEAFLDSSSIAAQGNTVYNLDNFVNSAHPLTTPCDITITGAAPGAKVLGEDVFSTDYDTTESNFIQAIDYAVTNGAKVLNESFGSNNFPDTALDATRIADDDAVAAGVTVVVSSGDAGVTNTLGSPATDPNLISVGASTTFRSYEQVTYGGINATTPNATSGSWLNNNISSLSSGGFAMSGANTVDLVAPGDLNWALCDADSTLFEDCTSDAGPPGGPYPGSNIELTGGTSESSPLTAAAAADVIQAYASTHHGLDPSPALVKQILMSTATDVDAPAVQQGAGLLNVLAAVKEAASIKGTTSTPLGGLLLSPNQINVVQNPGQSTPRVVTVTNTGDTTENVNLSTRVLSHQVATQTGSFCLNPSSSTNSCGPPTPNTFQIQSGVTEVYSEQTFTVPSMTGPSRLNFSADYPYTGQTSLLHVALVSPSGTYAGYSLPQGLADYANVQVANPTPGTWTAVCFTEQDGATAGGIGTGGTIQWSANESEFAPAGFITPSTLRLAPGATGSAQFIASSSSSAGDTSQSIVVGDAAGTTTIPVTIRTLVATDGHGGTFHGVLTGGNGRGNPAETDTYSFYVPSGLRDLEVSASLADENDGVVAFLLDPEGNAVAQSSNITLDSTQTDIIGTGSVTVYKDAPQAGLWSLVLDWLTPVSGAELTEPFTGTVQFDRVDVGANLPESRHVVLRTGSSYTFDVSVTNTSSSPEEYFLDPRTDRLQSVQLLDQFGNDQDMSLPLPPGLAFPVYLVPTDTSGIDATLTGSVPVTFDTEPFTGDPDLSPAVPAPGVSESQGADSASLRFSTSDEVMSGYWYLNPSEIGPYPPTGAPSATASATFDAITQGFDLTVAPSTGDLWTADNGLSSLFAPVYLEPGQSTTIPLTITPTAAPGTTVSGVINLDDTFQVNELVGAYYSGGDELASIPYTYTTR
jgi:hypothetical protein